MGVEAVVAGDEGLGVEAAEDGEQFFQPFALPGGTGVGGMAVGVEAALVADADGAVVQPFDVGTHLAKQARMGGGPVGPDVEVVAGRAETPAQVVAFQLFGRVRAVATGRGAVDHDEPDALRGMAHVFDLATQGGFAVSGHGYRQDWSPKAPKRVATMVAITFSTMAQTFCLGFSGSGLFSMTCCMC